MKEARLDLVARTLASGASRRTLLRGLGAAAIGTALIRMPVASAPPTKVTLCHKPGTPDEATIEVPQKAVATHVEHGDTPGTCPPSECPFQLISGPPTQAVFTFQDTTAGIASIVVTRSENADTVVPPFIPGTTTPITVTSTKIDQTQSARIEIQYTNSAGTLRTCDVTF
jgi:hypothetical protein